MICNLFKVNISNRKYPSYSIVILMMIISLHVLPGVKIFSDSLEDVLSRSNFSILQIESMEALFQEANNDNIPEEMLLPRLSEGVTKKVPASRILNVLQQNLSNIRKARTILLVVSRGDILVEKQSSWLRTATLLLNNVPVEDIQDIAEACRYRQEDYREATSLYISLIDWGVDRVTSVELITAFLFSSISGDSFTGVIDLLAEGRRQRIPLERLIIRIKAELQIVETLEELQDHILQ